MVGGVHGRVHALQGGMHGRGHVWGGGMHGRGCACGGCAWQGCGRGHAWQNASVAGGMCGRRVGYCSGPYASYWSAFLFHRFSLCLSSLLFKFTGRKSGSESSSRYFYHEPAAVYRINDKDIIHSSEMRSMGVRLAMDTGSRWSHSGTSGLSKRRNQKSVERKRKPGRWNVIYITRNHRTTSVNGV